MGSGGDGVGPVGKTKNVCAVVIAAWRSAKWIKECIESVKAQRSLLGWSYEIRLGVDGCEETRKMVEALGYSHYWSPVNVGAYIMRNSLIRYSPADAYAIFDADDVMLSEYLKTTLGCLHNEISGAARFTIDPKGERIQGLTRFRRGVCVLSHESLLKLGGYRPERLAADTDLIRRAMKLNIRIHKVVRALYLRRQHPDSLTQSAETGMRSALRKETNAYYYACLRKGEYQINPVLTPLTFKRGED